VTLLRALLIDGKGVDQLADELQRPAGDILHALRAAGFSFPHGSLVDTVSAAFGALGYKSFDAFAREHGLLSIRDQALKLGVSRDALSRVYDAYRVVLAQPSHRRLAGGDQGPGSGPEGDH
jgi:hypothetical protein